MYRAFICQWSGVAGGYVTNPVTDYLDLDPLGMPYVASMHYPDADQDGLPDKPYVLVLVWQPDGATGPGGETIEIIDTLPGVYMIPPNRLSKPVADIPRGIRNKITDQLLAAGVTQAQIDAAVIVKDWLYALCKHFQPAFQNFGNRVESSDTEFE